MKLSSIAVTLSFLSTAEGMGLRSIDHRHQVPASAQPSYEVDTGLPNRILRGEEAKISGMASSLDERELRKKKKKTTKKTTTKKVCCPVSSYTYRWL